MLFRSPSRYFTPPLPTHGTPIHSLPTEILLQIFHELGEGSEDLLSVALVASGWRNPAQEMLWKDVRLKSDEEAKSFIEASRHVVASTRRLRVRDGTAPAGKRDSSPKRRESPLLFRSGLPPVPPLELTGVCSGSRRKIGSPGHRCLQGTRGGRPSGQDRDCRVDPVLDRLP